MCVSSLPDSNPWEDPQWKDVAWTVYRGVAYDLTDFIPKHPGGSWLASLALKRDCTGLVESYHMRNEIVEARIKALPVLKGFPVGAVARSPYPNDSPVFTAIKARVRSEVFKGGEARGAHKRGADFQVACALGVTLAAASAYVAAPSVLTGCLLALTFAWIGTGVQHMGNHGALSTSPLINFLLGLTSDIIGGSSLVWRYHHQVSHHIQTNDEHLDEDVKSMHPAIRYDKRLPRYPHHAWQHLYILPSLTGMVAAWQYGDLCALLSMRTVASTLYGATRAERASILAGKLLHWGLVLAAPVALHDWAAGLTGALSLYATLGVTLGVMFLVSHNVPEIAKARGGMPAELTERDWGVQQIVNSANWGHAIACFFTGGLNLQIEHHLFPAVSPIHYPAISAVVRSECAARGIPYTAYSNLHSILPAFLRFMREVGAAEQDPPSNTAALVARL